MRWNARLREMNYKMANHKLVTVLVAIAALAGILVGSGHIALADNVNNKNNIDLNTPTDTQVCKTTAEHSPIIGGAGSPTMGAGAGPSSCSAAHTDTTAQSGGIPTPTP
jgi:hypothetical protein